MEAKKYKILHLIQTSGPGGAENLLLQLVQNTRDKYKNIVGLLKDGWLYQQLQKGEIDVRIVPSGGSFDLRLIGNLVNLIRRERIDLIHSHLLDMNFYSSIAAWIARVPHICTEHGDIHHWSKKLSNNTKLKVKMIFWLSKKIVFVSQFTKGQMLEITPDRKEKAEVIYNGVSLQAYERPIDLQSKKKEIGIRDDEFVVGNVGNLYPVKGQVFLLRAATEILKEVPNTKFIIIGRGELEDKLRTESADLGISSQVKLLGFRDDVKELLKIMDVFVLSSLSEGLPMSLIEAMASKVPVVATDVGGVPELIDDSTNGLLIAPVDPDALAKKLIYLLKDRGLANKLAQQGYEKIKHQFNLPLMLNEYEKIYSELIADLT